MPYPPSTPFFSVPPTRRPSRADFESRLAASPRTLKCNPLHRTPLEPSLRHLQSSAPISNARHGPDQLLAGLFSPSRDDEPAVNKSTRTVTIWKKIEPSGNSTSTASAEA